jgi:hypothetical protein
MAKFRTLNAGSVKITKKKKPNSDHQIQQSHWHTKTIFKPTQNPILLNIENNDPFITFPFVL